MQRVILSSEQYSSSCGRPIFVSHSLVCGCASVARWLVMWMKWPCSCQPRDRLDRPGVGLGGQHVLGTVRLHDAFPELLLVEPVDRPRELRLVRELDVEAALGDLGQLVPVRVQGRVDVDGKPHSRWYGSGVPGFIGQVRALPANALLRGRADPEYADGDDSTWMTVDWPSLTRSETVLGRHVSFVDTGGEDLPALLFLHGLGGLWQNWLLNIPYFMDRFRVIAPDLPGFGGSDMPAGRISIQGFARVIDALCDRLGIVDPVVVGNSMGGFIGAELALAFPTRVRKLDARLRRGDLGRGQVARADPRHRAPDGRRRARAGATSLPVVNRKRLRRVALQLVVRYPERLSVPLATELVRGAGTKGFVGGLDAVLGYSFRERLPDVETPVLIVWGRNDTLIPVEDAYEFERLIGANARVEVFEDTGHLAMVERPTRFNALLDAFIAGAPEPEAGIDGVHH